MTIQKSTNISTLNTVMCIQINLWNLIFGQPLNMLYLKSTLK